MATIYILEDRRYRGTLRLMLHGKTFTTDDGQEPVMQRFPSAAAAREHAELVVDRRRREGYVVTSVEEGDDAVVPPPDPLAGCVELDAARGRMKVTFKDEVPRGRCAEIVARVARDAPASVELVCDPARPGKAFGAALAGQTLPSVRAFIFDTSWQTVARQATNSLGDLSSVLAACPALERLFFTGDLSLSPAQHDRLQALYLIGDPIRRAALRGLGACRFPALATLAVTVAHERAPASATA